MSPEDSVKYYTNNLAASRGTGDHILELTDDSGRKSHYEEQLNSIYE